MDDREKDQILHILGEKTDDGNRSYNKDVWRKFPPSLSHSISFSLSFFAVLGIKACAL
jgi:hypothetical protein